jgi:hypothetical protein
VAFGVGGIIERAVWGLRIMEGANAVHENAALHRTEYLILAQAAVLEH